MSVTRPAHILPVIIFSQFTGTSLWLAGNAVVADLQRSWHISEQSVGYITSAIQLGFIVGTVVFALLSIADRFSPRKVFFYCAICAAAANSALLVLPKGLESLLILRFVTGFFLAGIYPVGMKIAAGWYERGLGRALGYLIAAFVIGSAFPHLLRATGSDLPWQQVIIGVSILASVGGVMMLLLVPDGPFLPGGSAFNPKVVFQIFRSRPFRASAFGYFGHMWELYAFWVFVPIWLQVYAISKGIDLNVSFWSFIVIAAGFLGCALGGIWSQRLGSAKVAERQLLVSGCCCLLSPLFFEFGFTVFILFCLLWGITVIGDSPQFSTLNAENAPREYVGSALTVVNSIGFLISIVSIELVNFLVEFIDERFVFWVLVPGPVLGLWFLRGGGR